jgi:hypothetical protein
LGCNCGKKKKYQVTTKAGEVKVVDTLSAAMTLIRQEGGRYQPVRQ